MEEAHTGHFRCVAAYVAHFILDFVSRQIEFILMPVNAQGHHRVRDDILLPCHINALVVICKAALAAKLHNLKIAVAFQH